MAHIYVLSETLIGTSLLVVLQIMLLAAPSMARQASSLPLELEGAKDLCGARVVLLGELPSHGEAKAFRVKAKAVRHLVEQCGFDAVLFEAPIYDFLGFEQVLKAGRAQHAQLDRAIGGFWMSRELEPWRHWLFEEARGGNIVLGGLDDQVSASSEYAREVLPVLLARVARTGTEPDCSAAAKRNLFWTYNENQAYDDDERTLLYDCARRTLEAQGEQSDAIEQVMLQNLANLYHRQSGLDGSMDRDAMMSQNAHRYLEQVGPSGKVVIWTATVHAAHSEGQLTRTKPLGAWLSEAFPDEVMSIGFTALAGMTSMAGRPAQPIPEAGPGSLEPLALGADKAWVFLDRAALRSFGALPSRLFGRTVDATWSDYFDGVVVFRQETAPTFPDR